MAKARTLQDWQTVCGSDNGAIALQNSEFYADVSKAAKVVARVDVMKLTNANLYVETAKVPGKKYWKTTETVSSSSTYVLTRDAGLTTGFLENLLRWRILSTNTNWQVTFRIQLFLK